MKYSQSFLRTTKETPKEAELVSHQYLLRGGFIAPTAAGIYTLMPLGYRVADKIIKIIEEELRAIGVEDIRLPVVQSARPWKDSGRFFENIDVLWKIKNNSEEDFVLAMTGEEMVTDAAKRVISSYKDLPKLVGQINLKVRDEARARGGLLRLREFMMQDAYSFDRDQAGLDAIYEKFIDAYKKIFTRIFDGTEARIVQISSDTGSMGGSGADEFMMITSKPSHEAGNLFAGEDWVIEAYDFSEEPRKTLFYFNAEKIPGILKTDHPDIVKDKFFKYHTDVWASDPETRTDFEKELMRATGFELHEKDSLRHKDFIDSFAPTTTRGIEVGNIFKLGTKYSAPQKLMYLDESNQLHPVVMGSYGIGVDRLIGSIVEASHDENGMVWPKNVSPYTVYLISIGDGKAEADRLYRELAAAGVEVFYDDRDTSAGEKFADADLLGFPYRVTISPKTLAENSAELKLRNEKDSKLVPLTELAANLSK